ncbi:MAG: hypothetical protein M1370_09955 [Bacteroidetes bacterium]|nr:hypothetical protein [Bacteroidota bacterium]MCL5025015.1 hypothetical protein [Chloroflexota bacterium]
MSQPSLSVLYYGVDEPLPEQRVLRAGPLRAVYEAGKLRNIRLGGSEILRQIYVGVRDPNWDTPQPVLSNLAVDEGAASFRITFDAEHKEGDIDFFWRGTLTGDEDGTITFTMDGEARSTFMRNRIGLCILHPIKECAGLPFTAEKVDGSLEHGTFPRYIAPHQPVQDMRAISYEVLPGVLAEVRFEGDVFEMEDQRNWSDASFKTYSTPLRLPIPMEVRPGTRIRQSVAVGSRGELPELSTEPSPIILSVGPGLVAKVPRLGLSVADQGEPLTEREAARLRALNLSHLRVDLRLSAPDYPRRLRQAADQARALDLPLEVALFLSDAADAELMALAGRLVEMRPAVCTWLVFHTKEASTGAAWVDLARRHLAGYDPAAKIGAGASGDFVGLNRGRPQQAADLICYSVNPQVHTFDNMSMVENLQGQGWQIATAQQIAPGVPVAVTPVTLKPRSGPGADGPASSGELPSSVDPRQMSLFGAAWTAGSLKYIAERGAYSATYYETIGWRGVMETEAGSPLPERFPSLPGVAFPLYHVLADVGEFAGGDVVPLVSSSPLRVNGLALRKDGRMRMIVANMGPGRQEIGVRGLDENVRVKLLDEVTAMQAMTSPEEFRAAEGARLPTVDGLLEIEMLPYAMLRIDCAEPLR